MSAISETALARWKALLDEEQADPLWPIETVTWSVGRANVRDKLLGLLDSYLKGSITTEQFRETFDKKTRKEWDHFGLKGMSGAMFLNMLVKHLPDQSALEAQLRAALPLPSSTETGRQRLRSFLDFLQAAIQSGSVSKRQIQPFRSLFFVSAWWHLQAQEEWPVFYVSARRVMEKEGIYTPPSDFVNDYFTFRDRFLALAKALGLSAWDLEYLCIRLNEGKAKGISATQPTASVTNETPEQETGTLAASLPEQEETDGEQETFSHSQVQWMLAKLGKKLGCNVWIATNDQNRKWKDDRLGDMSVSSLPSLGLDTDSQQIIALIDVVWMKGTHQVAAAFEVEHTTSIYSGILRMADLTVLSPNLNFPLYIVAPKQRLDQVKKQLSRPTFQSLELHKRCGYFAAEDLIAEFEGILKWATAPTAIDQLALRVGDVFSA